ncbi:MULTISPECIES: 2-oxoacid:acceptor oxidoreductase family protein [unclassified Adlercreutzia]|uniref:2-oxoacid:acceptor oxidoreductase family protein n=1 Tax=unclassified Adlercreutzia TaxID=2636013 RepID=UPI0013ED8098|nr:MULTISPECIES: 2-oxoacid:acceptor oxidoreductase family protein [unclassified Adlercreutzia]
MIEVLWHGRGGQGAFTAARLLGAAASIADGAYALAFPSFGPERRGAPMRAFTKISDAPIGDRSAIDRADYVIYLDDTLLDASGEAWQRELKSGGRVLVNSVKRYADERIVAIDANGLSTEILGRAIPNTVFLGALSVLCESVSEENVIEAIRQYMPAKLHAKNERIVAEARERVLARGPQGGGEVAGAAGTEARAAVDSARSSEGFEGSERFGGPESLERSETPGTPESPEPSETPENVSRETSRVADEGGHAGASVSETPDVMRACEHIPVLRSHFVAPPSLDPAEYARTTCYAAGHLVAKNAGWRNERPVINAEACTGCLQCYLYCPDGTIYKTPSAAAHAADSRRSQGASAPVAVDYDFCKGCGVCAKACRFDAIRMIPESEANAR